MGVPRWMERVGALVPQLFVGVGAPAFLQAPMNVFDGGLLLTLSRFTSLERVPYRDLWTLYGPGPPMLGSAVSQLFGPGLFSSRITLLIVQALLVAGVYALVRRFLAWWWAVVFASAVATFAFLHIHHFAHTLVLLLWGVVFILKAGEDPGRSGRRAATAAFLLGLSFLGRYEYALIGPALVLMAWWYLRTRLDDRQQRRLLLVGLAPSVLFMAFLLFVVGWERAWLNLVDYPANDYVRSGCRAVESVWGTAFNAFLAPLQGRLWTGFELTLWTATYVAPLLGLAVLTLGMRRGREGSFEPLAILLVGAITLVVWIEHRPRAGGLPHPLWPLLLVCAAILLSSLRGLMPRGSTAATGAVGALLVTTLLVSWAPTALPAVLDWPTYHPLYGFARGEDNDMFDPVVWAKVRAEVQSRVPPGEEIFVANTDNGSHGANAAIFYWVTDRPPASRFIEFDPCLTDTAPIQREIVRDIAETDVILTTSFTPNPHEVGSGPTVLDEYLEAHFRTVYEATLGKETILVLARS